MPEVGRDQPQSFGLPAMATCATAGDYGWQASRTAGLDLGQGSAFAQASVFAGLRRDKTA